MLESNKTTDQGYQNAKSDLEIKTKAMKLEMKELGIKSYLDQNGKFIESQIRRDFVEATYKLMNSSKEGGFSF